MKSDKMLWLACMAIYRESFARATPPADFDAMMKSGETKVPQFFMAYYLDEKTLEEIIDKHTKGLSKYEKHQISKEVYLGCTPTSVKKK